MPCHPTQHAPAIEAWLLAWLPGDERDYTGLMQPDGSSTGSCSSGSSAAATRSPRATVAAHLAAMRRAWGKDKIASHTQRAAEKQQQGLSSSDAALLGVTTANNNIKR